MAAWLDSVFAFNAHQRRVWVAEQARRLPPGTRLLDVGAGVGQYRELFAHCEYRAHDFAQEPATVGHYTPLDYVSDILEIPVPDGAFDAVLCTEVLEHVPLPIEAIRELARILRPGGVLLLSAPLGSRLHQQPYHFYGGYTPFWYERFLPQEGFTIREITPNRGFFSFFGQEAVRFSVLIDPRRIGRIPLARRLGLGVLWLVTLPLLRIAFPLLGRPLDRLGLDEVSTVGYHVVATKSHIGANDGAALARHEG
jgi:SAM-dependent methyltransferase